MRSCSSSGVALVIGGGSAAWAIPHYNPRSVTGPMALRLWEVPEGLTVRPDGSWRVGEQHVIHPPTLRYLKSHLVFEEGAAFVVDGAQRMPIALDGPPFEVTGLV